MDKFIKNNPNLPDKIKENLTSLASINFTEIKKKRKRTTTIDNILLKFNKYHEKITTHTQREVLGKALCDYLFYQSYISRLMVGRSVALKTNYDRWKIEQGINTEDVHPFIVYLGASRRLQPECCFCEGLPCSKGENCQTLNAIFGITEQDVRTRIDEVLSATYGTSNDNLITRIRENATLEKQMAKEII
jgi:hypothetical protein